MSILYSDINKSTEEGPMVRSPFSNKLKVAGCAIRATLRMQNIKVTPVLDIDDLCESVLNSPLIPRSSHRLSPSSKLQAIEDHKLTEKFFELLKRGSAQDLLEVENIILTNRMSFMREKNDPDNFVNKMNAFHVRPIHEAARNGNASLVKLLLKHGANPHLLTKVSSDDWENALDISARWGYCQLVEIFLEKSSWKEKELRKAAKLAGSTKTKQIIQKIIPKRRYFCI